MDVDALKAGTTASGTPRATSCCATCPGHHLGARSYDVVVRWGGDEFVCALPGVSLDVAMDRFAEMGRRFHGLRPGASISAGLAGLADDDTLES